VPSPILISRLGPGDVGALRALNALFAEAFYDRESYLGAPPNDGYLRELLARPGIIVLIAEVGDELAGGLVAYELEKFERARREVYLYDLAVAEPQRRRGVATALIRRLQAIARERGAWVVFVQADYGDEPAIALYEKLGEREEVLHFDLPLEGAD
jgi:aminoglycoside 3-N-acetyltransferase I